MFPKITIDLRKLKHNADFLCKLLHGGGVSLALVTKVFCAHSPIVKMLEKTGIDFFADSRFQNLDVIPASKPKILLRLPSLSTAGCAVAKADVTLSSEVATLNALNDAAKHLGVKHKTVLMIDLGDLREGIFYENTALLDCACETVLRSSNLELYGFATNLTCYGSVIPTVETLTLLTDLVKRAESKYGIKLEFVGGGNSSSLPLVINKTLPKGINNLRIGEAFVLGVETAYGNPIEGMFQDAFTVCAEIIEVYDKPSHPIGKLGMNAFGEICTYEDKGVHKRAIAAIGRQDILSDITPLNKGVFVIGSSSDHLLLECENLKVGDIVSFNPNYGALLRAFTSAYVEKEIIE